MFPNEYLYYQVSGTDFKGTNKLQAVELAGGDLNRVSLYFCDDEHAKYDWTVEPKESIHSLIDQRVIKLRNQYDYICLWYSGGYDSQTILNSFVRTNTLLDEVIIYGKPWIKDQQAQEHHYALQYAKQAKELFYPNLKINLVLLSDKIHTGFYNKYGTDWIYHDCQNSFSYTKASRALGQQFQPEFANLKFQKNRIDICGTDKPRVNLYNGKWYATMSDTTVAGWFDSEVDLFYMCPDATNIYIKQCWNVIKWFETFPNCTHDFVHNVQGKQHEFFYADWNRAVGRDDVYYETAKLGLMKKYWGQGVQSIDSNHYKKSNNFHAELQSYRNYVIGLTYLKNRFADIWSEDKGWNTVMSKSIFIKDFETINQY